MLRALIFFGCFLVVAGSAWAQLSGDRWQPARQLQPNPQLVQGFDAWYQQQRDRQQQQHIRYRQENRQLQPNPPVFSYGEEPIRSASKSLQDFDRWYQHQREEHRQQHERYRQEARDHEWNQRHRLREYGRLRRGPLQPY
ncbi:MAG: hypothetical protein AB7P17_14070 [Nitrospirales bacterium]